MRENDERHKFDHVARVKKFAIQRLFVKCSLRAGRVQVAAEAEDVHTHSQSEMTPSAALREPLLNTVL